jgi:hypothetical protein
LYVDHVIEQGGFVKIGWQDRLMLFADQLRKLNSTVAVKETAKCLKGGQKPSASEVDPGR